MESKRRLDARWVFVICYVVAFLIYFLIGLQPAEATERDMLGKFHAPLIGLKTKVVQVELENQELKTPDYDIGGFSLNKNKLLLFGHSSTVFGDLDQLRLGNVFYYNNKTYKIIKREILPKEKVVMAKLLREEKKDTVVVMTCSGDALGDFDYTKRLIITAVSE